MMSNINLDLFTIPVVAYDENERICGENNLALEITHAESFLGKPLMLLTEEVALSHSTRILFKQDTTTILELVAKQDPRRISGVMRIEHELISPLDRLRSKLFKMNSSDEERSFFEQTFNSLRKKIQEITLEMSFRNGDMQLFCSEECNLPVLIGNLKDAVNGYYDSQIVTFNTPSAVLTVKCDENKLLHALLHVISNSIKMADDQRDLSIIISLEKEEEFVLITVSDNGRGFETTDFNSVTEAYNQAKASLAEHTPGLGVGLYLVKKIIHLHDGTLELGNNDGTGAFVKIRLPQITSNEETVLNSPTSILGPEDVMDRTAFMLVDIPHPNEKRDD